MIGAWFALTSPAPTDVDAYAQQLRDFSRDELRRRGDAPGSGPHPRGTRSCQLVSLTGAPLGALDCRRQSRPDDLPRTTLSPASCSARYDARIAAPDGSALARGGDPSSAVITPPFAAAARSLFVDELGYGRAHRTRCSSSANANWDSQPRRPHAARRDSRPGRRDGAAPRPARAVARRLPRSGDAVPPDRARPRPARVQPGITLRVYAGGHMTYLDDGSRPRIKAAWPRSSPAPARPRPQRRATAHRAGHERPCRRRPGPRP